MESGSDHATNAIPNGGQMGTVWPTRIEPPNRLAGPARATMIISAPAATAAMHSRPASAATRSISGRASSTTFRLAERGLAEWDERGAEGVGLGARVAAYEPTLLQAHQHRLARGAVHGERTRELRHAVRRVTVAGQVIQELCGAARRR